MPKKKKPDPSEKPQMERFVDAARELGVHESGEEFEKAFRRLVPPKLSRETNQQSSNSQELPCMDAH